MKKTKWEMMEAIESWLRSHRDFEVVVKEFGYELRNGRRGLQAYCLVSDDGINVWCKPYSGANIMWLIPWRRLSLEQVKSIYNKLN